MTGRRLATSIAIVTSYLHPGHAQAADVGRYPRENAAIAGDLLGGYAGSYQTFFIVSLQFRIDPTFSAQQKNLLDKAARILVDRALKPSVIDCAYDHSFKDLPGSRSGFERQLYNALSPSYLGEVAVPSFGFIARYSRDPDTVGRGYVGLYYDRDNVLPGYDHRHYFHVALNSDHMGPSSSYAYREDAEYWAGVVGHEFLHNLGYRHPTGYPGSFIKEYGKCIAGNGQSRDEVADAVEDASIEKDL